MAAVARAADHEATLVEREMERLEALRQRPRGDQRSRSTTTATTGRPQPNPAGRQAQTSTRQPPPRTPHEPTGRTLASPSGHPSTSNLPFESAQPNGVAGKAGRTSEDLRGQYAQQVTRDDAPIGSPGRVTSLTRDLPTRRREDLMSDSEEAARASKKKRAGNESPSAASVSSRASKKKHAGNESPSAASVSSRGGKRSRPAAIRPVGSSRSLRPRPNPPVYNEEQLAADNTSGRGSRSRPPGGTDGAQDDEPMAGIPSYDSSFDVPPPSMFPRPLYDGSSEVPPRVLARPSPPPFSQPFAHHGPPGVGTSRISRPSTPPDLLPHRLPGRKQSQRFVKVAKGVFKRASQVVLRTPKKGTLYYSTDLEERPKTSDGQPAHESPTKAQKPSKRASVLGLKSLFTHGRSSAGSHSPTADSNSPTPEGGPTSAPGQGGSGSMTASSTSIPPSLPPIDTSVTFHRQSVLVHRQSALHDLQGDDRPGDDRSGEEPTIDEEHERTPRPDDRMQ
ncbi:uncharacterized protein LTR77_008242 [Saxophila tyrrhenica]|uniref:Uncharacterized protein n=1 Tax=Saxophila tyrrhenica TaxID=1690608 RepID=A0AAV9P286_9PEZI|nr:hypothetical protein LTR77_008242 [Saxophila tyrrhenica]